MTVLRFQNVHKSFTSDFLRKKRPALHDISFEIGQGETFAYLGHNGAGKTTSIKALLGLIRIDGGEISLFGRPPGDRRALARIGYVPEKPYFYDHLTGREFLQLVADLHDVPHTTAQTRIAEVLELVSMTTKAGQRMRGYSKGMLQRIGLGQALINDPDLLVLDEPMGGIDPMGRHHIRTIVSELKARGKTILMSSHILSDVEVVADRAAILSEGHLRRIVDLTDRDADQRAMEVQCRALQPQGEQRLREAGFAVERGTDVARIRVDDRALLPRAIGLIQDSGGHLLGVAPVRMDLERIFLHEVRSAQEHLANASGAGKDVDELHDMDVDTHEHVRRILDQLVSASKTDSNGREEVHS